jgi:Flp pilus assembly protein TadG
MKTKREIGNENGGSAVEFAIILPLLLLFVFGIIEWSLYLYNRHIITNAGREGVRQGIVQAYPRVSASDIESAILEFTGGNLVTFGVQEPPGIDIPAICTSAGDDLAVTVTYDYSFLVLPALTLGSIPEFMTITADTVMRCE